MISLERNLKGQIVCCPLAANDGSKVTFCGERSSGEFVEKDPDCPCASQWKEFIDFFEPPKPEKIEKKPKPSENQKSSVKITDPDPELDFELQMSDQDYEEYLNIE